MNKIADFWKNPLVIARNNFVHKSLSSWSLNGAVGCLHKCLFCYVPQASTIRMASALEPLGVKDPDAEWGEYVFARPFHEKEFRASLAKAVREDAAGGLNADGNRAIMMSTTTDPYQMIYHSDPAKRVALNKQMETNVREALLIIRDESDLNVRILTRSPLAVRDFELFRTFGPRLMFGMSIPTLNEQISRLYEPHAPSVGRRRETLRVAKVAGLHIYVAMAPLYPECDRADIEQTMKAWIEIDPLTIFAEPINMRAENVARIEDYARDHGYTVKTEVFASGRTWGDYARAQLELVATISQEMGTFSRLHLWPDKDLPKHFGSATFTEWCHAWWDRISEWPRVQALSNALPTKLYEKDELPGFSDTGRERAGKPH